MGLFRSFSFWFLAFFASLETPSFWRRKKILPGDEFARDCALSQINLLILLNFDILGCGPKEARFPGALQAPAIAAVQERAARRRLSARQGRNISVGH
jgi:hypothetical protein